MKEKQAILISSAVLAVALCVGAAAFWVQQPAKTVIADDNSMVTSMVTDKPDKTALPDDVLLEQAPESTATSEDVQAKPLENVQESSQASTDIATDIADVEDAASAAQTSTQTASKTAATASPTATTSPTTTPTVAPTQSPVATATPTLAPVATATPTLAPVTTPTPEPIATPNPTPVPTATPVPTPEPTVAPVVDYSTLDCAAMTTSIYNQMNALRTAQGLAPLAYNGTLAAAANIRAVETTAVYDHTRPDGTKYYTAYNACGYAGYSFAGENISRVLGSSYPPDADSIATALYQSWVNSATHLANMVDGDFTQVGIGVVYNAADGKFYAVQNFS